MIISRTPFRISFVGGGSDLEAFYSRSQGAVLSTSINKYMYISSHKYFDQEKFRVKYSQTETVSDINELKHPILRETMRLFNVSGGLEISSIADIPSGTGMGSSSTFTVGLFHTLYAAKRTFVSKEQLSEDACNMEIEILKEPIGKQDQYAAAFGGLNVIRFNANGLVTVEPLYLKSDVYQTLQDNLVLFFIGNARSASSILIEQKKNVTSDDKFRIQKEMVDLVFELRDILYQENLDKFGSLLHQNWILKKQLASGISNPEIDNIYDTALRNGALGGKLLGAGAGGFMLFYCEQRNKHKLVSALHSLRELSFRFDQEGSKLIYFGDE